MKTIFKSRQNQVEIWIAHCQDSSHVQQVAFSTYHHALTQICFTCKRIRTSLKQEETKCPTCGK